MQTLQLKNHIIYGPVNSRRLGRSLGINILPKEIKACTFNCAYCQYGWNQIYARPEMEMNKFNFPSAWQISDAVSYALIKLKSEGNLPAYLTFSGNGEPSLHPEFPQIVKMIINIKNELSPESKTAILSNSTYVHLSSVREALTWLDERIMKLDCGQENLFRKYNKPAHGITLKNIIEGLESLSSQVPVTIQTLFSSGKSGNFTKQNIARWVSIISLIKPVMVQIYSLSRGYPDLKLKPVLADELKIVSALLNQRGIPSGVY